MYRFVQATLTFLFENSTRQKRCYNVSTISGYFVYIEEPGDNRSLGFTLLLSFFLSPVLCLFVSV